ncbi:ExbD/TolR family protein [Sulfitobacter porphyrae]|uniref:ExbD/TolR family protein n=1 Tax=Sulfitobacter porphyrae TaxID=1246864 RepID=A0ABW2B5B7_9RHOB
MPSSVVPMINVVFLLLIFFMMTARIAPPPPFEMTLPASDSETPLEETATLYLGRDGVLWFRGAEGAQAWTMLGGHDPNEKLTLRGDAQASATALAGVLRRLAGMGITSVELALRPS